jgi:hypothetical protein
MEMFRPTREQFEKLSGNVCDQMREFAFPFVPSISCETDTNVADHHGSGLYIRLRNETYILTNEHVARVIQGRPLAHQLLDGEYSTRIMHAVQAAKAPYDLALTKVDASVWNDPRNKRKALDVSKLARHHDPAEQDFLFMLGYSGQKSFFSPSLESLMTNGTPYLTQESKDCPDNLGDMYFAIPYLSELAKSLTGKSANLPDARGFSGSPVWDTRFRQHDLQGIKWSPEESQVTGVIFLWRQDTRQLIAVKAEYIVEFLLYALRCVAAYFRWLNTGEPDGTAMEDWTWAEHAIPSLVVMAGTVSKT